MQSQAPVQTQQQAPLSSLNTEAKMHKVAEGFVGTFFAQMVGQMFSEANESNEEGFQSDMYSSFLEEGMAEKIAASGAAQTMVTQVEKLFRRQGGLEDLKGNETAAHKSYKTMGELPLNKQEDRHVFATAS
jgi:Rod binding domain-containing protein